MSILVYMFIATIITVALLGAEFLRTQHNYVKRLESLLAEQEKAESDLLNFNYEVIK